MILVLGGTSDSLEICKMLNNLDKDYKLSVATDYGEDIAKKHAKDVIKGRMNKEIMIEFMRINNIQGVIDATHPYAVEVSKNAIESCKELNTPYLRYERKSLIEEIDYENKYIVSSIEEACKVAKEKGENIFVGTGSKNIAQVVNSITDRNLIVRVLPTAEVIESCEKIGLNADNIIAMKGPFSQSINEETYKHYDIDVVITKESGISGGFIEKVNACKSLNIPVVIVARQEMNYPNVINDLEMIREVL